MTMINHMRRSPLSWLAAPLAFAPAFSQAQHDLEQHRIEEVFVTGELVQSAAETAMPVGVLAGEDLRRAAAGSLGETLRDQTGVTSSSFGAGVGLPVIRGQSGGRISVVQNGLGAQDAASVSPDHANSVDPLIAERIEIIRGPATLLYGNGAIGGVVNVIDNRIPERLPDSLTGAVEARHNTVSSEDSGAFKVENKIGQFAWHIDGALRDSGTISIPGWATNEEALHAGEHEEEHAEHEEDEAIENSYGYLPNSDSRSSSFAAGGSWIGGRGFAGLSISHLTNEYGLPPGSHLHADEEEHAEEEHEEHEEHAGHEDEDIRIDLNQTRYTFKAGLDTAGLFNRLNARLAYTDYEHTEFALAGTDAEAAHEEEHDEEHEEHAHADEVAHQTRFTNRGLDGRFTAHYDRRWWGHNSDARWNGVSGLQFGTSEFAVVGDEGFLPRTDIDSAGIFVLESITAGRWIYELGARLEHIEFSPETGCTRDDTTVSANLAAIWRLTDNINTSLSFGRAQRSAGVEERYSNVATDTCAPVATSSMQVHNPTGLVEVGNPDLERETSHNVELSFHKHLGTIHGELNLYSNRVDDYIYLAPSGETVDAGTVAFYQQNDAEFYGYEAEITAPLPMIAGRQVELTLFSEAVHAELTSGEYLPRIPPAQGGIDLALLDEEWSVSVRVTRVADAQHLANEETPTEGYTLLDVNADYHFGLGGQDVLLFAKGSNLLDETVRNHTSFVKDLAPEPGRGVKAGIRVSF